MTLLHPAPRLSLPPGLDLRAPVARAQEAILTPAALAFVAELERAHRAGRRALLQRRRIVQSHLEEGHRLALPDPPAPPRACDWQAAPAPADLQDLRIGIAGPATRAFLVPALNSKACVVAAEIADALAGTWDQVLDAQTDLCDAVRGTISWRDPDTGSEERLGRYPSTLTVRPRALDADETGLLVDGAPVSATLFDAGLYLFHNAHTLHLRGSTPAFVLAGIQVRQEAEWWCNILARAEQLLGLPAGAVRVILQQDEVLAAFDLDEVLWRLRERIVAVSLHRAGYLSSWIRCLGGDGTRLLPDPSHLGPDSAFLRAWRQLVVRTAHRRGVRALGTRSTRLPMRGDPLANHSAMDGVRQQKRREARDGMDGAWVTHPELVFLVREVFDAVFPPPMQHQMDLPRATGVVAAADLVSVPRGACTLAGLRANLDLAVRWQEALLRGSGRVRIGHAYYDTGDAELARRHVTQWLRLDARLEDGSTVDPEIVERELKRSLGRIRAAVGPEAFANGCHPRAARNVQLQLSEDVTC